MKKTYKYLIIILALMLILGIMLKFTLFNNSDNQNVSSNNGSMGANSSSSANSTDIDKIKADIEDKKRGDESYNEYNCKIDLNTLSIDGSGASVSNNTITIAKEGVYYFSGTNEDCNIVVNAGDDSNVVLVFENANITSKKTAVINGINAKNIVINLKEGSTNTFTDSSNYTEFTEDDEPDATVFSKTDLKITGKGTLVVNANYQDAIASKDDLIITDATIKITAKDDGLRGKDSVNIKDANITITTSDGDTIKATNEDDSTKGYVVINGGTYNLSSADDGIHAETALIIDNANINITKSVEGLEGMHVEINSGDIKIVSSDDGINATDGSGSSQMGGMNSSTNSNVQIVINGGSIYVNAAGDGLDANGNIVQTGGDVVVVGTTQNGNGALDYDGTYNISGGTLIAYGATGMWQNPSTSSTQNSIAFSNSGSAGDKIEIKDSNGNTIASFTTEKAYGGVVISSSKIEQGKTYTLYVNGNSKSSQEQTSVVTSQLSGEGMMGGGQMQGGMMRQRNH